MAYQRYLSPIHQRFGLDLKKIQIQSIDDANGPVPYLPRIRLDVYPILQVSDFKHITYSVTQS